ncbi:amino acid adenylation domain-containing protein [Catenulispora sp. EB89]|uniref:non-ribosomal peptide synthetase n=1 Tax=Catenulispora sp. EB89 TaxID=3156257 RepID=UPI003516B409
MVNTDIPARGELAGELPLSFNQEQLWFIEQFHAGLPTYNVPHLVRLRGGLDVAALGRALDGLVERHEALRTRFVGDDDGRPVQVIDEPGHVELTEIDTETGIEPADEAARPFALDRGPLLRAHLIRHSAQEHVLLLVTHHVVFDALSSGVLLNDLAALYQVELAGTPAHFAPLWVQPADVALWEREQLRGDILADLVTFWRTELDGLQTAQLPADRPRPLVVGHHGGVRWQNLGAEALAGLRTLSEQQGVGPQEVLTATIQVLLHRYTGQDDIVIGTAAADRGPHEALKPLIGFLVNTLPIRSDLSGDPEFRELLARVAQTVHRAREHQSLPFARLVEEVPVERDTSRAPIFQVGLTFSEALPELEAGGVSMRIEHVDLPAAKFDLDFAAHVRDDELWLRLTYDTGLYDPPTAERILGHVGVLLAAVTSDPSQRLSKLPILTEAERHREVVEWNDTATELPDVCIHEGFERQVDRTPDAVAAELDGEMLTYAQLNARANQIARRLREAGAGPEILVGVAMAPSIERLAVLLGIMKAGSGYVPLDPALPAERLSYMMSDTAMPVVVADEAGAAALPATTAQVVAIDQEWDRIAKLESENPGYPVQSSNIAYVIYTSGSTGQPKGVVVEHRHAVNFLLGMLGPWQVGPDDRVLQFASLNFDVSVMDLFMTLLAGARAVLAGKETLMAPPRLADLIRDRKVTFACLPPAVVSLLTGEQFPDLRILLSAGEELPAELVRRWLRPGLHFYNGYGPTEAAIGSTFMEIDGSIFPPPIGRPKPNYQAYVLDRWLNPVPVGVVGELHVGGAGVTRGYLNAPELTEQRFIPDPFRDVPGARLYKTGDLVRRNPDGTIVFVGRVDGQVKIRGIRIELGEIEAALVAHEAVEQAVVVVSEDRAGHKRLVGYVRGVPGEPAVNVAQLRQYLATRLPASMVPAGLLAVDAIPLTANGKIDRKALPAVESAQAMAGAEFVAPRTMLEAVLTDVYAGLLRRDRVGVDDGFFDLGGNSLQAMQLVARLRSDLAVDIDVTAVFQAPAARQLAVFLRDRQGLADVDLDDVDLADVGLDDVDLADVDLADAALEDGGTE